MIKRLVSGRVLAISEIRGHVQSGLVAASLESIWDVEANLTYKSEINFKMGVDDKSKNKRGLTIFGQNFGSYNQDLLARVLYTNQDE